jgi:3-oxoacyl-[acyl-carrier protein] reductase
MPSKLNGKVAIITGGGRGIGRGIALGYGREGAIVIVASRTEDEVKSVAQDIREQGGEALGYVADIRREEDVHRVVESVINEWGKIDVLVNNAGVPGPQGLIHELDLDEAEETLTINILGTFLCCRAVVPYMIGQGGGNIINVSSGAGQLRHRDGIRSLPYQMSKFGVEGLTNGLATQLRDYKINVNSLLPGMIATRLHRTTTPDQIKALGGKLGQPEDVVPAAVYLGSLQPGELTDQIISAKDFSTD